MWVCIRGLYVVETLVHDPQQSPLCMLSSNGKCRLLSDHYCLDLQVLLICCYLIVDVSVLLFSFSCLVLCSRIITLFKPCGPGCSCF